MNNNYYIDLKKNLIKKGPKFCSQQVVIQNNCLLIKPTLKGYLLGLSYLLIGISLFIGSLVILLTTNELSSLFFFIFGIASMLGIFGVLSLKKISTQGCFNKNIKKFKNEIERSVLFENILSFQINAKKILASGGELYSCYELNMLTANGRRINILNHNDLKQIKKDAKIISDFMNSDVEDFTK